jgi:uncharacterized protein YkwD
MIDWKCVAAALALSGALPAGAMPRGSLEADVLAELNYARANPQRYAAELRDYREGFEGTLVYARGSDVPEQTREGVTAVDDAIRFLERQTPLPPLSNGDILAAAAIDMVTEQGPAGALGHVSRSGLTPGQRVRRRGGDIYVGETISYGFTDPRAVVRQLIVDDGEPRRGHRILLFSRAYRYAGVGCGRHAGYGAMCVIDLSGTPDGRPALPAGTN